jgi:hypothetical protein
MDLVSSAPSIRQTLSAELDKYCSESDANDDIKPHVWWAKNETKFEP